MSAKRFAGFQLTDENSNDADFLDDRHGPPDVPKMLTKDQLGGRVLAKPKSRLGLNEAAKSQAKNAFAALGGAPRPAAAPVPAPEQALQLRALNEKFLESVASALKKTPDLDLSKAANKYLAYHREITAAGPSLASQPPELAPADKPNGTASTFSFGSKPAAQPFQFGASAKPTSTAAPAAKPTGTAAPAAKPTESSSESESDSDEEDKIPIRGPKFTLAAPPIAKDSPFSFDAAPAAPASVDSSKPVFQFDAAAVKKSKGPFKFAEDDKLPQSSFSFGAKPAEDAKAKSDSLPSTDSAKPFTFGAPAASSGSENGASKFTFGDTKAPATNEKPAGSAPKLSFNFGSSSAPSEKKETATTAPALSFGTSTATAADAKEEPKAKENLTFTFGSAPSFGGTTSTPKLSFGTASDTGKEQAKAPAPFTFGQKDATPAFGAPKSDATKPFSFSAPSDAPAGKFTFGKDSGAESKPGAFTFGKDSGAESKPGAFTFGKPADGAETKSGAFTFGKLADGAESKPGAFTFGSAQPAAGGAKDLTWKPGQSINFAKPGGILAGTKADGDGEGEGDGSDNGDAAPAEPQVNLSDKGPGEEDETSQYEVRAKVFENVEGKYEPQGVGILRVLQHNTSKKSRVLVRVEGSGNVILNVRLLPQVKYTVEGNNMVKVTEFKSAGICTYLVKVKDGEALKNKLEELKA